MLIDTKGREVKFESLPKGKHAREAALAKLREVPSAWRGHGTMFHLQTRARARV